MRMPKHIWLALVGGLAGCDGRHSWLAGAGAEARLIEDLFWPFLIGAVAIWTAVMVFAVIAFRRRPKGSDERIGRAIILWGGGVLPAVVVAALLITGLLTLRAMASRPSALTVHVDAEQWWWRVIYETPDGKVFSANEIRLPLGKTTLLMLTSDDVIHSFWAPALGGKLDMIPGRTNRMTLTPVRTGRWGGLCAEFCGAAHAQMRFEVVVMEPDAFRDWLVAESEPAAPSALRMERGLSLFLDEGCAACHTVRGTQANGRVGPDLTHLAARGRIGAGLLALSDANLRRWITHTTDVKPGVRMPSYPAMPPDDLDQITQFLMALE
ncbi:cytochrome c oxidase subunit II [Defluviimonas sp. WL0002]|uniref:Cytochrome aa3 subunit 2 n=1 Tax=Albidovulum marisflavi TaxID=2984159 RepID=A0ABT2ZCH3_9RHOB|nr:cytochrome c oxidase subunit II [Defluviimonas sp. WL0002]MCV2868845.1 cytochrome c oxidase subunit II [Defluviimonas sp. WL0002]